MWQVVKGKNPKKARDARLVSFPTRPRLVSLAFIDPFFL